MPLWIVQHTGAPPWAAGFVTFVNTVMVVALQIRMSKGSERPRRARSMMIVGGLFAAVAAALAPLSVAEGRWPALAACVLVVVVMTVGELFISAGSMGLALVHTPSDQRPVYLATYNLGFAAATVVGPPLVTVGLVAGTRGWLAWAGLFVFASIAAAFLPLSSRNQH
jgi:MFS family permease